MPYKGFPGQKPVQSGLVNKIVEKFGNNSTCSNLYFTFEMKKTFENFEMAKIQPGLVKKEVNQSRKLGQN